MSYLSHQSTGMGSVIAKDLLSVHINKLVSSELEISICTALEAEYEEITPRHFT